MLIVFYIFREIGIKTFLLWFINNCLSASNNFWDRIVSTKKNKKIKNWGPFILKKMGLGLKVIFRTGLGLKRGFLTNKLSCPILRKKKEKRKKSLSCPSSSLQQGLTSALLDHWVLPGFHSVVIKTNNGKGFKWY